jgi:hypothetical protein
MQPRTAIASAATLPYNAPAQRVRREIWPAAVITFGLVLSFGWTCLLGYGLIKLVQLAI